MAKETINTNPNERRPRRLLSQEEMNLARRLLGVCYLCGNPLPPRGPGFKNSTSVEHVVPRELLGSPPPVPSEAWPVVLDVHRVCEENLKRQGDDWLQVLQRVMTQPPDKWPPSHNIRSMPGRPEIVFEPSVLGITPVMGGLTSVFRGIRRWVQGLHAAIYQEVLLIPTPPPMFAPVPVWSQDPGGPKVSDTESASAWCRKALRKAVEENTWDGIRAWGGELLYGCVWWDRRKFSREDQFFCFWELTYPGVKEWSRQFFDVGEERPWHGWYSTQSLPPDCSLLNVSDR